MHIGISTFPSDLTMDIIELAKSTEARGFESLWVSEHTHVPVQRDPLGRAGGDIAEKYLRTLDPFVALTAAAMVTRTLRLGFGVLLVSERDPIVTAKSVASLDQISAGRVLCGIGAGWITEEVANHGVDPQARFRVMYERAMAMKEIWSRDEAEFHGQHVSFDPIWQWPKPVQDPVPVLIGGNSVTTMERVIGLDGEWFPGGSNWDAREELVRDIGLFHRMCEDRLSRRLPVTVYAPEPTQYVIDEFRNAGVNRIVLPVDPSSRDGAKADLDAYEQLLLR